MSTATATRAELLAWSGGWTSTFAAAAAYWDNRCVLRNSSADSPQLHTCATCTELCGLWCARRTRRLNYERKAVLSVGAGGVCLLKGRQGKIYCARLSRFLLITAERSRGSLTHSQSGRFIFLTCCSQSFSFPWQRAHFSYSFRPHRRDKYLVPFPFALFCRQFRAYICCRPHFPFRPASFTLIFCTFLSYVCRRHYLFISSTRPVIFSDLFMMK